MMWRYMLVALLCLCSAFARAQTPPIKPEIEQRKSLDKIQLIVSADRRTISLSERLHYALTVEAPLNVNVIFQSVDDKLGPFKVIDRHPLGPVATADHINRWRREYTLEAEQEGEFTIPALAVELVETTIPITKTPCLTADNCAAIPGTDSAGFRYTVNATTTGAPQKLVSDPVAISVTSVVPKDADTTKIKDIAPPVELPLLADPESARRLWLAAAGVLLALVALMTWRRRRKPISAAPAAGAPVALPAHHLALAEIARLAAEEFDNPQRVEEFYLRLSAALRRYLGQRFGLPAPLRTTDEVLATATANGSVLAPHGPVLAEFLRRCDGVKFGRQQPNHALMQRDLASAKSFIEVTAATHATAIVAGNTP